MADRPATTSKKKTGRKRRVAGWLLLVIGVLITGVWGASGWWTFGYRCRDWSVFGSEGVLVVRVRLDEHIIDGRLYAYLNGGTGAWRWTAGDVRTKNGRIYARNAELQMGVVTYVQTQPDYGDDGLGVMEYYLNVALGAVTLVFLLSAGGLLVLGRRARRRAMTGVCVNCGYDLAGLSAGAPCPECGKGIASAAPRR